MGNFRVKFVKKQNLKLNFFRETMKNKLHDSKNGIDKLFINSCGGEKGARGKENTEQKVKPEASYKANITDTCAEGEGKLFLLLLLDVLMRARRSRATEKLF